MVEPTPSSSLSILVGSFNTYKRYPPSTIDLSAWLTHPSCTPHIVAVGFQELPISYNFLPEKSESHCLTLLDKTLPHHRLFSRVRLHGKYHPLANPLLNAVPTGMLLLIYVQPALIDQCSSVGTARVPTVSSSPRFTRQRFRFSSGFPELVWEQGRRRCSLRIRSRPAVLRQLPSRRW